MADGLMKRLKQAVQMEKGEITGRERVTTLSRPAPHWTKKEIQHLRNEVFHMDQTLFASLLNVKPAMVRAWEQGQRTPDGAAVRLLELLSNDHELPPHAADGVKTWL